MNQKCLLEVVVRKGASIGRQHAKAGDKPTDKGDISHDSNRSWIVGRANVFVFSPVINPKPKEQCSKIMPRHGLNIGRG